ncbi:hypothetical protein KR222_009626, partial [Zaprionus bogoriensis]
AGRMSRRQLPVDCVGHGGNVLQLAYSKVCDSGYYLASACQDGQAMLRHGDTGDWVGTFGRDGDAMLCVDINRDATRLATGGEDFTARIWNAVDGKHLRKIVHTAPVRCVALGARSDLLAVGCLDRSHGHRSDNILYAYALENPEWPTLFKGQTRGIRDVIFCRDDRAILSSSHDRSIRLWDRLSGQQEHSITLPHHAKSLELCADGRTVTIAYDHSVVFVDVDRFEVLQHRRLPARLVGASLHPEKQSFVCADINRRIYKCDYQSGEILESFKAHERDVRCIKYSPDGEVYASCADKGALRLWQQTVGKKYALWDTRAAESESESDRQESESA